MTAKQRQNSNPAAAVTEAKQQPKTATAAHLSDFILFLTNVELDKDMSVCLPDLVASIHRIFQTVNCSSITKQELVHKIILNNFDIIERREVEEYIELLEKLVPEWISRKLTPSGDILYSIKKLSDLASVQAKVVSA